MAIKLHDWKTIRELRLCTAAGLINPMEFKILLAPQVFLNQGEEDDDDDDDDIPSIGKSKKGKKEIEEKTPAIGFHIDPEEDDDDDDDED